jgi:UDP-N-acetylglucosamine 2-epimerase (non-hydrolysing)
MNQKIAIFVFGTRPELIKLAPLILEAKANPNIKAVICSTGQHRDMLVPLYNLFQIKPDIDFDLMKTNQNLVSLHSETMLRMIGVIEQHKPNWVVVQGDTTSAHAAAMAAFYQKIPVAHVEAGLRTYDINSPFPEEMNRRAIGLVAKLHLCPTDVALRNLESEKIDASAKLMTTGNTGIDALNLVSKIIDTNDTFKNEYLKKFNYLNLNNFVLATMHRRENFGTAQLEILKAFLYTANKYKMDLLFPVHPNPNVRGSVEAAFKEEMNKTVFKLQDFNESQAKNLAGGAGRIFLIDPLDYTSLVFLMKNCRFVMTDSGGIQEEAPTFKKKILVLRNSTERPEGVTAGFSTLVGTDYKKIIEEVDLTVQQDFINLQKLENPFGDGQASRRIIQALLQN